MRETLFIGKKLIELDSTDSTNSYAANLLQSEKVTEGTVVMAHFQSSGRGQRGNVWHSSPGENLMFTILFQPSFLAVNNSFLLSKLVALGIANYLESCQIENVQIKWPNDILVENKKICGVLIENQYRGAKIANSIVGIGLNVNQTNFGDLRTATSLALLKHEKFDLKEVLMEVLASIEKLYMQATLKRNLSIEKEYLNRLLNFNALKNYKAEGELITAKITGVMPEGKIKMEMKDGTIQLFSFKEIEFIL